MEKQFARTFLRQRMRRGTISNLPRRDVSRGESGKREKEEEEELKGKVEIPKNLRDLISPFYHLKLDHFFVNHFPVLLFTIVKRLGEEVPIGGATPFGVLGSVARVLFTNRCNCLILQDP